jgi:molybdopterin/thiamine biosynthesis adenylyltransferase
VFPQYRLEDTIHIQVCGNTLAIPDLEGKVATLFGLMDGTRTVGQIIRELCLRYPDSSAEEVWEAIRQLDEARVLEDAAAADNVTLSEYDTERWHRDRGFFETYATLRTSKYELQERVQACTVVLLGVGGVGSHVLLDLLGLGVRNIRIVDFDRLELSNLNRQILYRHDDVGRSKVEAAVEHALAYQPRVNLEAIERRLSSPEDVIEVITGADVVISAVDSPKMHIMKWVNEGCVRSGITLMTGGLNLQRSYHYTIIPGVTGCIECWRLQAIANPTNAAIAEEMRRIEENLRPGQRFGQDYAAFGPLVTAHTACLVNEFVRVATGLVAPVAAGRMMELNFADLCLREAESWHKLDSCSVCGAKPEFAPPAQAMSAVAQ